MEQQKPKCLVELEAQTRVEVNRVSHPTTHGYKEAIIFFKVRRIKVMAAMASKNCLARFLSVGRVMEK